MAPSLQIRGVICLDLKPCHVRQLHIPLYIACLCHIKQHPSTLYLVYATCDH